MAINYDQGVGFSEHTGYWPMPDARSGIIKIIDDIDQPHVLVLDHRNGLIYDIAMREGPTGSGINKIYTDLADVDGSNGFDIEPEVEFKEDTGEYERFVIEHNASRFYVRPDDEQNRNADGRNSGGYLTGTEFVSEIFVDGEPTTATASANDVPNNGEITYDKTVEGNRIYSKFRANKSGFSLVKRQQEYIVKDINYNFSTRELHEGLCQKALATTVVNRCSRTNPLTDRITKSDVGITGYTASDLVTPATITRSLSSGADQGVNSAIKLSGGYANLFNFTPEVDYVDGTYVILAWIKPTTTLDTGDLFSCSGSGTMGEINPSLASLLASATTINGYTLYAKTITTSGSDVVYINAVNEISVFDARMVRYTSIVGLDNPSFDEVFTYMYKDGNNNSFNNICPTVF